MARLSVGRHVLWTIQSVADVSDEFCAGRDSSEFNCLLLQFPSPLLYSRAAAEGAIEDSCGTCQELAYSRTNSIANEYQLSLVMRK
jgi:hypothetical protein